MSFISQLNMSIINSKKPEDFDLYLLTLRLDKLDRRSSPTVPLSHIFTLSSVLREVALLSICCGKTLSDLPPRRVFLSPSLSPNFSQTHILNGLDPRYTCRDAFKDLEILTIAAPYVLKTVLLAMKEGQTRPGDQHTYNTRHRHNFMFDVHHVSSQEEKFSYRGASFYNCLTDNTKSINPKKLPEEIQDNTDRLTHKQVQLYHPRVTCYRHEDSITKEKNNFFLFVCYCL